MALTDYKASEIFSGVDISSLSDRPNEDGITTPQLKARFDYLIKNMIPLHNSLINALIVLLENGNETNGHKHNVDNLIDGTTNRLFTETLKLKLDSIASGAEVNQNAFSSIKVGGSTGNADSKTATFEIVAGLNIVASIDPLTNKITLSATGDLATEAVQSLIDDIGNYYNSLEVNGALQEIGAILYPSLAKTTPHDDDTMLIVDSQDDSIFKKLSWANIKTTLKSYFDTLYQAVLTSGTTIKTINETSILGSGNISVQPTLVSGTNIKTVNGTNLLGSGNLVIPTGSTYTVYTATIPSSSWTGSSAPYSKAVTVSGILATDVQPSVNTVMTGTYATDIAMQENLAKIYRIVNTDNTLTCYANSIPTADIPIQIVVVR